MSAFNSIEPIEKTYYKKNRGVILNRAKYYLKRIKKD